MNNINHGSAATIRRPWVPARWLTSKRPTCAVEMLQGECSVMLNCTTPETFLRGFLFLTKRSSCCVLCGTVIYRAGLEPTTLVIDLTCSATASETQSKGVPSSSTAEQRPHKPQVVGSNPTCFGNEALWSRVHRLEVSPIRKPAAPGSRPGSGAVKKALWLERRMRHIRRNSAGA